MTDQSRLPDDEIVSAHLDGEATPDEAARVAADPDAQALLATFGSIAARVAEPVRADDFTREAALAAALDVFDQSAAASAPTPPADRPTPDPGVVDLAARRSARARRNVGLLSMAAAVVAVLLIGAAVLRGGRNDTQTTAANIAAAPNAPSTTSAGNKSAAPTPGTAADSAAAGSAESSASPPTSAPSPGITPTTAAAATGGAPTTTTPGASSAATNGYTGSDLGALAGPDDVRRAVAGALGAGGTASDAPPTTASAANSADSAPSAAAIARCTAVIQAQDFEVGTLVFSATATFAGAPALVLVYTIDRQQHPAANGGARIYTVDRDTCRVLDVQTV